MRSILLALAAAALAAPALAQPLREQSPAPQELLDQVGQGSTYEELARVVAAASGYPLGTADNPVRVGGPEGARAYLGLLRCADGSAPIIGERTAAGVGAYGTIVDAWPLDCGTAAPGKVNLVIDLYHDDHLEDRAPLGFAIVPR